MLKVEGQTAVETLRKSFSMVVYGMTSHLDQLGLQLICCTVQILKIIFRTFLDAIIYLFDFH